MDAGTPLLLGWAALCFRSWGWACDKRYEMIWSAVMPISMALRTDCRVIFPVTRLGKRYFKFVKREISDICRGEDVYA